MYVLNSPDKKIYHTLLEKHKKKFLELFPLSPSTFQIKQISGIDLFGVTKSISVVMTLFIYSENDQFQMCQSSSFKDQMRPFYF